MAANADTTMTSTDKDRLMEEKKARMTSKLQQRDNERISDAQKRKDEQESVKSGDEKVDIFLKKFGTQKEDLNDRLAKCDDVPKPELIEYLDNLLLSVQSLQKFLTDSTFFLTAYQVEKSKETITKLQADIQDKRDIYIPKKKFAFKAGKKKSGGEKLKEDRALTNKSINIDIVECSFSDQNSQTLIKSADDATNRDIALTRLTDCLVILYGSPSAIHINQLKGCTVLSGPVSGSIFIDECINCTFVFPCQQLRIHNTSKSSFYIHVTSRAIIEDCKDVGFAPYTWSYNGIDEHYKVSGLDKGSNNWHDIDDFNWLVHDAHSPNWFCIPEAERTASFPSS